MTHSNRTRELIRMAGFLAGVAGMLIYDPHPYSLLANIVWAVCAGIIGVIVAEITRVSKPGRRVYAKIKDLPRVYNGLGISILSTPQGVMSDAEARAANVGGEVLAQVF